MNKRNKIKTFLVAHEITGYHIEAITGRYRTAFYNSLDRSRAFLEGFYCGLLQQKADSSVIDTFKPVEVKTFGKAAGLGELLRHFATSGINFSVPVWYLAYNWGVDFSESAKIFATRINSENEQEGINFSEQKRIEEVSTADVEADFFSSFADINIKSEVMTIKIKATLCEYKLDTREYLDYLPDLIKNFKKNTKFYLTYCDL